MSSTTSAVVLDCGGETCKIGFAGQPNPAKILPNCGFRPKREHRMYLSDQIEEFMDLSSILYRRPFDRGYLVNTDLEADIWDRMFHKSHLDINCSSSTLLLSEPPLNFPQLRTAVDELVFEKFDFSAYCRASGPSLASWLNSDSLSETQHSQESFQILASPSSDESSKSSAFKPFDPNCCLILDSGFSFTHAVPIFSHLPINNAIRRLDLGGKALTNHLKETISYRHYNFMDEFYLVNQIKEKMSFVSSDFLRDLKLSQRKSPFRQEFVLPNGSSILQGFVKTDDFSMPSASSSSFSSSDESKKRKQPSDRAEIQTLALNNERFTTPELLFHPSDLGIHQVGIPELIAQSIQACPSEMQPLLWNNILLTGGNANLPGFAKRVVNEVRALAPADVEVHVFSESNPSLTTWRGASRFAIESDFSHYCVTRAEFQEHGAAVCSRKFAAL